MKGREWHSKRREQQVQRYQAVTDCYTSEMVGAGARGAGKRRRREEVKRVQGHEGDAGDVNLSTA